MRPTNSKIISRSLLIATLVHALAAGPAFAQQDFSGIPGLGASIPPKVFIIYDTSNSMRDLPQTQQVPTYLAAPDPLLPDGGTRNIISYRDDDWDPTISTADGGQVFCDNRFCVGKRVLYNLLPTYADSLELGLAGYYQYRTQFTGTGTMRCVYDVLSAPNLTYNTTGWATTGLTSGVPTQLNTASGFQCDSTPALTTLHTYNFTELASTPGVAINCLYNYDYGASKVTGTSVLAPPGSGSFGSASVCSVGSSGRTLVRDGGAENIFRGGTMGNSNIWVRMARGTTLCPATIDFAGSAGGPDSLAPAASGAANTPSNVLGTAVVQAPAFNATAIRDNDISAGVGAPMKCNSLNPCRLSADQPAPTESDDAGVTVQIFGGGAFGVASPPMTFTGVRTYSRVSGPANNLFTWNPVANAGSCMRADASVADPSDEYFIPAGSLTAANAFPGAVGAPGGNICNNPEGPTPGLGMGCRVTVSSLTTTPTAGTVMGPPALPPGTVYQDPTLLGSLDRTCNVPCGITSTVTYVYTPGAAINFTVNRMPGASCASLNQTNYQGASLGPTFGTPATSCNAGTPCTIQGGAAATDTTRTGYASTPVGTMETATGPVSGGFVDVPLTSYVASCPSPAVPNTSATYGCSAGNPCNPLTTITASPMDGGTGLADIYRLNNAQSSFVSTADYALAPGSTASTFLTGAACGGAAGSSLTKTSGNIPTPLGTVTCGSVASNTQCALTGATPMCSGVPCTTDTYALQNNCRYNYQVYTYKAALRGVCRYERSQWTFTQQRCTAQIPVWTTTTPACTGNCPQCTYNVQSWVYYYLDPYPYCRYYATRYPYTGSTSPTYNYSWKTKGGEYVGSFEYTPPGITSNYCLMNGSNYTNFATQCPTEISSVVNSSHPKAAPGQECGNGRQCLLRWRNNANTDAVVAPLVSGRTSYTSAANRLNLAYQGYNASQPRCLAPDRDGGETVMPDVTLTAAQPLNFANLNAFLPATGLDGGGGRDYCRPASGTSANEVRIRADWYEPTRANVAAGAPGATLTTRGPFKQFGLSLGDGGNPQQTFVNIAAGNLPLIQQALSKCVYPESDAGLLTPLSGGLCMAETGLGSSRTCNGSICQNTGALAAGGTGGPIDFTPLVGSLVNTKEYLQSVLANDNEHLCRDYYVILVSDGNEDTPAAFLQTDIRNAVGALRNPNPTGGTSFAAGARTKDVKTFVIGFGAGLNITDGGAATDLDIIARTGGSALIIADGGVIFDNTNGRALSAASQSELESALSLIFNNITGGAYTRSRPTLTSDGTRLYHAFFERGSPDGGGSPEWKGNLIAYDLPASGGATLTTAWEHQPILDGVSGPGRDLVAFMTMSDGGTTAQNFVSTNSTLTNYIDTQGSYPNEGAASVKFARNDSLGELFTPISIPRRTRVGAFVFSSPVAVGRTPFGNAYGGQPGEASRDSFYDSTPDGGYRGRVMSRPTRILIGGNDGIWRGVSDYTDGGVNDGKEAWGIVPAPEVLKNLPTTRRRAIPLVDGTTAVSEVCWPASGSDAKDCLWNDWRAVGVIALRQGGESLTAVELKNDGSRPTFLWRYDDSQDYENTGDDLALTYAPPIFGRVEANGKKKWVAFFGGGQPQNSSDGEGDSFYIVDAKTGQPYMGGGSDDFTKFDNVVNGGGCQGRQCPGAAGRPATWRRENKTDTDTVYFGSSSGCDGATSGGMTCTVSAGNTGKVFAARVRPTNDPKNAWKPKTWWDPRDNNDGKRADGQQAPIWKINKLTGAQTWPNSCRLPLGSGGGSCNVYDVPVSFYNRPKLAAISDSSSVNARPDMFIGTGDTNNLNNLTEQNFFFGIHDRGFLTANPNHDGEILWAYAFDPGEKITGEPAVVSGAVIVPTFVPPVGGTCQQFGDAYLYAFDPITGAPRNVLQDPASPTTFRSVVRMADVGALSDLVVVNGRVYYATTRGGVGSNSPIQTGSGGRVQGWRRVR